jgi:hypothetical protein
MKTTLFTFSFIAVSFWAIIASAQKPAAATDFTLTDCDGADHHLFGVCDNGDVVMMEFVMGCLPCVQGRSSLTKIEKTFNTSNPGKIHTFTFGFSGGTECSSIQSWMTTNKFFGITFAGDDEINANYGSAGGMPTIVIVGGTDHKVLYWKQGFSNKDTTAIKAAISKVLPQSSVLSSNSNESLSVFPNPSARSASLRVDCLNDEVRQVTLYNANGINVLPIFSDRLSIGEHTLKFSTEALASGTYYIHVTTAGKTSVLPLTIVH